MNALMVVGVIVNAFEGLVYGLAGGYVGFAIYTLIAVGISVVGMIVIATGSKKAGAILVIIGAIGFVPIGLIAIFGARRVLNEAKWEQASTARDKFGLNPLITAAGDKNPEVITTLLKAGADIEARELHYGNTALLWAAWNNPNPEVIATLLIAGADIEARDKFGLTPLMYTAIRNKNPENMITTLLKAGADAKAKNKAGMTAFDYAKNNYSLRGTDALKQLEEASK